LAPTLHLVWGRYAPIFFNRPVSSKAWAEAFCNDVGALSCEEFAQQAEPMCLNAGGDS